MHNLRKVPKKFEAVRHVSAEGVKEGRQTITFVCDETTNQTSECKYCGRTFYYRCTKRWRTRTCSPACFIAHNRARQKDKAAKRRGEEPRRLKIIEANRLLGRPTYFPPTTQASIIKRSNRIKAKRKREAAKLQWEQTKKRIRFRVNAGTIQMSDFPRFSLETALLVAELMSNEQNHFTPEMAARLRSRIGAALANHLDSAVGAMSGASHWTPSQVKLFGLLLGKVVPDLSASFSVVERRTAKVTELTRDELERIAYGHETAITIEATPIRSTTHDKKEATVSRDDDHAGATGECDPAPRPALDPGGQASGGDPLPCDADDGFLRDKP